MRVLGFLAGLALSVFAASDDDMVMNLLACPRDNYFDGRHMLLDGQTEAGVGNSCDKDKDCDIACYPYCIEGTCLHCPDDCVDGSMWSCGIDMDDHESSVVKEARKARDDKKDYIEKCKEAKKKRDCGSGCNWDKDSKTCDSSDESSESDDGVQGPDYWEDCVQRWCDAHVWYGGIEQCHWEPEYGCMCETLGEEDCEDDDRCEYDEKKGCRDKIDCESLDFDDCLTNLGQCALCGDCCKKKCILGPNQELPWLVSLWMDDECTCRVAAIY